MAPEARPGEAPKPKLVWDEWLAEHRSSWRAGTPGEIVSWLRQYEAAGTDHAMLMYAPHTDVQMIDVLAREVLPAFD